MPVTVRGAFDVFREMIVDLETAETKTARSSRDFLCSQLGSLKSKVSGFPPLDGSYLNFGSFARRTKIRPLNDIDVMTLMNGRGTSLTQGSTDPYKYWLRVNDNAAPLAAFKDNNGYVSSTSILNKIKNSLYLVSQYLKADIKRTQQAVALNLKSYAWTFDIVPAVPVASNSGETVYYLIPDGTGKWSRTDPRVDSANATRVNGRHSGRFLPIIRLLKYWNNRTHNKSRLSSYYFETLGLQVFDNAPVITGFPEGVKYFFDKGPTYLLSSCPDPKRLGANLDADISWDTKQKIASSMRQAAECAGQAINSTLLGQNERAIHWWKQVFGPGFPSYG